MNAEKFNLNKIYFGGFFIRGELLLGDRPVPNSCCSHARRYQVMLLPLLLYLTRSDFGVKGRKGRCSYGMKDSCELSSSCSSYADGKLTAYRGALGAWIKNMEPAVRDSLED